MRVFYVESSKGDKEVTFWNGTPQGATVRVFAVVAKTQRAANAAVKARK